MGRGGDRVRRGKVCEPPGSPSLLSWFRPSSTQGSECPPVLAGVPRPGRQEAHFLSHGHAAHPDISSGLCLFCHRGSGLAWVPGGTCPLPASSTGRALLAPCPVGSPWPPGAPSGRVCLVQALPPAAVLGSWGGGSFSRCAPRVPVPPLPSPPPPDPGTPGAFAFLPTLCARGHLSPSVTAVPGSVPHS